MKKKPCACGCKELIDYFDKQRRPRSYIVGHRSRHTTEETRKKMSLAKIGQKNFNWGKFNPSSEETKKKISLALTGEKNPNWGKKASESLRKKMSLAQSGEKHSNWGKRGKDANGWKNGRYITSTRYVTIYNPTHPYAVGNYVLEHRLLMEKNLNRYLTKQEVVHHQLVDRSRNEIEYLMLFDNNIQHIKFERAWASLRRLVVKEDT